MKDKEIIKALEHCMSDNPPCTTCKYDGDTITVDECMGELMKDALDLINRQMAEIESKNDLIHRQSDVISEQKEKLERIYAEAVKEFAERLKELKKNSTMDSRIYTSEMVDNLVKEMAGEG